MIIKSLLAEKGRQKAEVEVTKERVPPNSVLVVFNVTEGAEDQDRQNRLRGKQGLHGRGIEKVDETREGSRMAYGL